VVPTITINEALCIKCGLCVQDCVGGLYIQNSKDSVPEVHDLQFCISCGHCSAICPTGAITHSGFSPSSIQPINRINQPSSEELLELLRTRRSMRVFQDKPVEKQQIERIIDAARFAPTAHNTQATQYIVIQNKKIIEHMAAATTNQLSTVVKMAHNPLMKPLFLVIAGKQADSILEMVPLIEKGIAAFKGGNDIILRNAPVLIIFHADELSMMPDINAHLAIQNATLMAHSLGLGSFYTGLLLTAAQRDKSIGNMINLPKNHKIYGGLAIGYPKYKFKKWIERKTPEVSWL
jgi:nitroreductase/NAD-dependent dihydropyrimidine dehydrogenase PreA subunit